MEVPWDTIRSLQSTNLECIGNPLMAIYIQTYNDLIVNGGSKTPILPRFAFGSWRIAPLKICGPLTPSLNDGFDMRAGRHPARPKLG